MRGSVIKRGRTWTYVISLGKDASGKKRQKWVGGHRTKKAAEDALVEALERMRTGMWVDPGTTRGRLPGTSAQKVDHPYKCR